MPIVVPTTQAVTAISIIKRSLRIIGVLAEGETPSNQEASDGLEAFNALMGSVANSRQLIYARTLDTVNLSANVGSYTVGPLGDKVTDRPVEVLASSYITYQGVDYPLVKWTLDDYNSIMVKSVGGIPVGFYVQPDMPDVTVSLWPVPSETMTLNLWSNKQIKQFATLTQELAMPPGYDRMFAYVLAVDLAPEYLVEPSANVIRIASSARRVLKRTNTEVPRLKMPAGIPDNNTFVDWRGY